MNDDYGQNRLSREAKIAIGIGGVVVVIVLGVVLVLFLQNRSTKKISSSKQGVTTGAGAQATSPAGGEDTTQKNIAEYLAQNPPMLIDPPANLQYDVELTMTDAEKRESGYSPQQTVIYKWVHPNPSSGSKAPIKLIVRAPQAFLDSDVDGISDSEESRYGTDSKNPDTDGDGVLDGVEVYRTKTDPTKKDTNDDGVQDVDTPRKK